MTIGDICNREVITMKRDSTVLQAASLMRQFHVGDVVITDRDIVVELVATELDCNVMTTGDIMTKNLIVIKDSFGVFDAIKLMSSKGIRRIPVVDNDGALVGIVTFDDLLVLLTKEFNTLVKLIPREQKNEEAKRP
jgi:CBS domain-containing protein